MQVRNTNSYAIGQVTATSGDTPSGQTASVYFGASLSVPGQNTFIAAGETRTNTTADNGYRQVKATSKWSLNVLGNEGHGWSYGSVTATISGLKKC